MNQPDERPDMLQLDDRLRPLAIAAQNHPKGSLARKLALTKLIKVMQESGKICRPRRDQFQGLYKDIYAVALQELFFFICDRIDAYNPQKGEVLQWANFLLNTRFFIKASREFLPITPRGIDARTVQHLTVESLDELNPHELNPQQTSLLSQQVKEFIQEDPDGLFRQNHVAGHPAASFQYIALKRLENYSWQELSIELNIPIPTLSSFYQRCLTRFAPVLRTYLL